MLRTTIGRYLARFGAQSAPAWHPTARAAGLGLWRRNFTTIGQSSTRNTPLRTSKSFSARSTIASSLPKARDSRARASRRNFHHTSKQPDSKNASPKTPKKPAGHQEPLSLSARMKKLSREYGWAAFGVYMGLSAIDFPFCYLLVRVVGPEKIGEFEHWIVSNVQKAIPQSIQDRWHEYRKALKEAEKENTGDNEISEHVERVGWGVEEAEAAHQAEASLGTQLALAYAIHKSFIFVRVPLTVAITPKVVKVLRSLGWNIGKRKGNLLKNRK